MKKDNLKLIVFIGIVMFYHLNTVGAEVCECNSCISCTERLSDNSCDEVRLINDIFISNNEDFIKGKYGRTSCIVGSNVEGLYNYSFNDKIFDCQGHEIKRVKSGDEFRGKAINFLNIKNSVIKNCIISGFSSGIEIGGANNKILNNSISFCSVSGISLGISGNNEVIKNEIYGNSNGLYITGSSKNTIINNKIHSNINGITLYYHANFNNIVNNKIYNNSETGIYMMDIFDRQACKRVSISECSQPNTGNEITKNEITKNRMAFYLLIQTSH